MVNKPHHYGGTDCIDALAKMLSREEMIGFLRGTIFTYMWRWRLKDGERDLAKAKWYQTYLDQYLMDHPEPTKY